MSVEFHVDRGPVFVCAGEDTVPKIVGAECRISAMRMHPGRESRRLILPARQWVFHHPLLVQRGNIRTALWIGDRREAFSADHDCLDALGSHHRAQPHPWSLVCAVGNDTCESNELLTGRADDGGVNRLTEL